MKKSYTVDARIPAPARTLLALVQSQLRVSKKMGLELVHDGLVAVNGRVVRQPHWQLEPGDQLELDYAPQPLVTPTKNKTARRDPFEILFDDADLMVVVKPAGLLTVPTPKREKQTLIGNLNRYLARHQPGCQAYSVHRLDRGVSGLLVFGKSLEVALALREQFQQRKPKRQYTAIVVGRLAQSHGTIRNYLATDADLNRYATADPDGGELAITHYQVREQLPDAAILSVRLETGRRNQIRVHLANLGHPILGDPRYATDRAVHRFWPYSRLGLHAETLGLIHPRTGESLELQAPWPQEFRDFRRKAGRA